MKIKEFEKAIDALCAGVTIDEMKLKHSNVRQANAHTDSQLIVWDEYGRAFSAGKESERELWKEIKVLTLNSTNYDQYQKDKESLETQVWCQADRRLFQI